jgi:hypothetical protein
MTESKPEQNDVSEAGMLVRNIAEPIKLSDLQLKGVSAEAARGGDNIRVWTRLYLRCAQATPDTLRPNRLAWLAEP